MKHKNFRTQEDPCARNAQGISKFYQEVFLLMKFYKLNLSLKIRILITIIYIILLLETEMKKKL